MIEAGRKAQIQSVRDVSNYARKADNLSQALYPMPRGYLPQAGVLKILDEIERCAGVMAKSGQPQMVSQAQAFKAEVAEKRGELKETGATGPGVEGITTKQQVEIVREAAKYLHGFLVLQLKRNPQYCQSPQTILRALDFSRFRVVVDYFNNLDKVQMQEDDPHKARLALERAAEVLKPWVEKVDWVTASMQKLLAQRCVRFRGASPGFGLSHSLLPLIACVAQSLEITG